MKLLYKSGAVIAVVLAAAGLIELWKLGGFLHTDPRGRYLVYLMSGVILTLTVNIFHLYDRIAALEKRIENHQPLD
jgi:hypothetical protein